MSGPAKAAEPPASIPVGVGCYLVVLETPRFAVVADGVLAEPDGVEIHLTALGADLPAMPGPPSAIIMRSGSWLGRAYAVLRVEPLPGRGDLQIAATIAGPAAETVISGDDLRRAASSSTARRWERGSGGRCG